MIGEECNKSREGKLHTQNPPSRMTHGLEFEERRRMLRRGKELVPPIHGVCKSNNVK